MEIPVNTYKVEDDPRTQPLLEACTKELTETGNVFIDMTPLNDYYRKVNICCEGQGRDEIAKYVLRQFAKAGYHTCIYNNGYCYPWAKISRIPFDVRGQVEILS